MKSTAHVNYHLVDDAKTTYKVNYCHKLLKMLICSIALLATIFYAYPIGYVDYLNNSASYNDYLVHVPNVSLNASTVAQIYIAGADKRLNVTYVTEMRANLSRLANAVVFANSSTSASNNLFVTTTDWRISGVFGAGHQNCTNSLTAQYTRQAHSAVLNAGSTDLALATTTATTRTTAASSNTTAARKYYIYTSTCHMPYISPDEPDAVHIFKRAHYKKCANDKDLVTLSFIKANKSRHYELHTNQLKKNIICCYQQIIRAGTGENADKRHKLLPCANFHQNFVVPKQIDYMFVNCKDKKSKKLIQRLAFSLIQPKYVNATQQSKVNNRTLAEKPSIIFIGIDSLSRINFRRNMPLTAHYLEEKNWFQLEGYNKMGDNTYPNLMALLTGYNHTQAYQKCKPKTVGGLNKCTYLWDHYKQAGYHTAYAEDWVHYATFNYLKKGFLKQPTDYYLRPMVIAMEDMLSKKNPSNLKDCMGRRHYAEYIYDYAVQLTDFYENEPIFGFFWANTFSHDDFRLPSSMDTKMLQYLTKFEQNGVLNRAIVILISDHGMRFGPLRKIASGFVEERLPMFYMSLPKWFQAKHAQLIEALNINRYRLTSPFDIYNTLNHILNLIEPTLKFNNSAGCAKCGSIFYVMPENRSCADAGITEHWCACNTYSNIAIPGNNLIKNITQMIIDEINNYLMAKNLSSLCKRLTLNSVSEAEQKENIKHSDNLYYRIKFEVAQNKASFEATVDYNVTAHRIIVDVESISRLNTYKIDSLCIADKQAKLYCICKK